MQGNVLTVPAACLVGVFGLWALLLVLKRDRPDLEIGRPLLAACGVRLPVALLLSATGLGAGIRGGDEETFLYFANALIDSPLGLSAWLESARNTLHHALFAAQIVALGPSELALRITQIAIAVAGLALLATAVHDMAGARAGRIAMWVLALEPSNVFFTGIIHKESLMLLAEGLVVYGGVRLWTRGSLLSVSPMLAGCAIAIPTRAYAGWFMVGAVLMLALHASLRYPVRSQMTGVTLLVVGGMVIMVGAPTALTTADTQLTRLQVSQDAVESDESNLRLQHVEVSTPGAALSNLPIRMGDMLTRPYPWEVRSTSQRLGVAATLFMLVGLFLLVGAIVRNRGRILVWGAPFVYPLAFELVAYSLAAGNAGTAFRYRTHLVALGICLVVVLRQQYRVSAAGAERSVAPPPPVATPARRSLPPLLPSPGWAPAFAQSGGGHWSPAPTPGPRPRAEPAPQPPGPATSPAPSRAREGARDDPGKAKVGLTEAFVRGLYLERSGDLAGAEDLLREAAQDGHQLAAASLARVRKAREKGNRSVVGSITRVALAGVELRGGGAGGGGGDL